MPKGRYFFARFCAVPLLAAAVLLIPCAAARAQLAASDSFNYQYDAGATFLGGKGSSSPTSDGSPSTGAGWGSNWLNGQVKVGQGLDSGGTGPTANNANHGAFADVNNSGTFRQLNGMYGGPNGGNVFVGFLAANSGASPTANNYAGISLFTGSADEHFFMGELFNSGKYGFGGPAAFDQTSSVTADNKVHQLVYQLDFTSNMAYLYVDQNADPGAAHSGAVAQGSFANFNFDAVRIQAGNNPGPVQPFFFDSLKLNTSFIGVLDTPAPPGMISLLIGMTVAAVRRRRAKRAA